MEDYQTCTRHIFCSLYCHYKTQVDVRQPRVALSHHFCYARNQGYLKCLPSNSQGEYRTRQHQDLTTYACQIVPQRRCMGISRNPMGWNTFPFGARWALALSLCLWILVDPGTGRFLSSGDIFSVNNRSSRQLIGWAWMACCAGFFPASRVGYL